MAAHVARPRTVSEHTRLPASAADLLATPSTSRFPEDEFHKLVADLGAILGPSNGIDDGVLLLPFPAR